MVELRDRLQTAVGPAYRIDKELGGGGMSRVFLAEQVGLGRSVVVKVLPPEMAAGLSPPPERHREHRDESQPARDRRRKDLPLSQGVKRFGQLPSGVLL
jgi:serine/threonine protein kinase